MPIILKNISKFKIKVVFAAGTVVEFRKNTQFDTEFMIL